VTVAERRGSASPSLWPEPTEDRRRLGTGLTILVAVLVGWAFRVALSTLPIVDRGRVFVDAAVLTAVLAVLGLRSLPVRWVVRSYALIGAVLLLRLGTLADGTGVTPARDVILWAVLTAAAMALCPSPVIRFGARSRPDRSTAGRALGAAGTAGAGGAGRRGVEAGGGGGRADRRRTDGGTLARGVATAAVLVAAVTLLVGPWAGQRPPVAPSGGQTPDELDNTPANSLTVQNRLDMTRRPRLSDTVVMTVRSDIVSFWRNATYDVWDGTSWINRDGGAFRMIGPDGRVAPSPIDIAATTGDASDQEFRLQAGFANALPIAPSATSVTSPAQLIQRPDGSIVAPDGLGEGATYTVTSRQVPVTAEMLSGADGPIPASVAERYASSPETTARVRRLAERIVADAGITGSGAATQFAKVKALEDWMGAHLTYSLDAPLSPSGVDVVDDFLFRSKEGWCEQIASSLVVMLRQVGVPARLATGYAPGEFDAAAGRFVVRERDAHAWAEVWFPALGWVPFDPTASVPYAGDAHAQSPAIPIGFGALAVILLFVAAVVVLSGPLAERLHRWRERRRAAAASRRLAAERWDVRVERELEELGREVGRPRAPAETVSAHARELAAVTGRAELADQGAAVDDFRYAPPGSAPDTAP